MPKKSKKLGVKESRGYENSKKDKTYRFTFPVRIKNSMESLILAQDERWRRA